MSAIPLDDRRNIRRAGPVAAAMPALPVSSLLPVTLLLATALVACSDGDEATSTPASTTQEATSTEDPASTGTPSTGETLTSAGETLTSTTSSDTTGEPPTTSVTGEPPTTSATTGDPSTSETTDTDGTGDTTDDTGATQELPPRDSAEHLEAWLLAGSYKTWAAESGVHPSTGPHGGNVRTFVNAVALASLAAKNPEHPQDAATVKELYGASLDQVVGYAVTVKTAPDSQGGATWYWYERIDATTYGDDLGVGLCTGCHGGGADYILTPFPLQ